MNLNRYKHRLIEKWRVPNLRWLVLTLIPLAALAILFPVWRYQMACQWVRRRGGALSADEYNTSWLPGVTVTMNVKEIHFRRGTIDQLPTPHFLALSSDDINRLTYFSNIEKLSIAGWTIPEDSLESLSRFKHIKHIDVIRSNVNEEHAVRLSHLMPDCTIRYLPENAESRYRSRKVRGGVIQ